MLLDQQKADIMGVLVAHNISAKFDNMGLLIQCDYNINL
jgi:hypothetical protein